ncbi:MAG: TolC family protein [Flavobacteriales bacterium]|nr:TolC family protein [Flavobacteriales bacterium]
MKRNSEASKVLWPLCFVAFTSFFSVQTFSQVITLSEAKLKAEQSSALVQSALLELESNREMEGTAFNLYQPQLLLQAPTGNFYTIGVQQNFDFPSVYSARKSVLKSETDRSEIEAESTKREVRYKIGDLYIHWQTLESLSDYYGKQQNDFLEIRNAAVRSFEAGEIDLLEKSFAELKYLEATRIFGAHKSQRDAVKRSLVGYLGLLEGAVCDTLGKNMQLVAWSTNAWRSALVELAMADVKLSEGKFKLLKRQNLPGFFVGYMNQGERSSAFENRLNAGVSIPLWFWHTGASKRSAKLILEKSQRDLEAVQIEVNQQFQIATGRHDALVQSILMMKGESLPLASQLINNAGRMYEAGEISLSEYIRMRSDAAQTELSYIQQLQELLQTQNQLQFITAIQ